MRIKENAVSERVFTITLNEDELVRLKRVVGRHHSNEELSTFDLYETLSDFVRHNALKG